MNTPTLYFAYGSNMSVQRLCARIPGAQFWGTAGLKGHALKFHKPGRDGSGKCDAAATGHAADTTHGVLYAVHPEMLEVLDRFEERGHGYERCAVAVTTDAGQTVDAQIYLALHTEPELRPYCWYKEHVVRGARENRLPQDYVAMLDAAVSHTDPDTERRWRELAIYQ